MTTYTAKITWTRGEQPFLDGKYSRAHVIAFDGGVSIAGSSSPAIVRVPLSKEDAADPEQLLVASASACHMLFFLDFARRGGFRIDSYEDAAEGVMDKDERGILMMTRITLRPRIAWSGDKIPSAADIEALHHKSHEACYIANSLRGETVVEPRN
jgi:organic hydroperoxide reductase OsmC/OhrA